VLCKSEARMDMSALQTHEVNHHGDSQTSRATYFEHVTVALYWSTVEPFTLHQLPLGRCLNSK